MSTVDRQVRAYYGAQALSPDRAREILRLAETRRSHRRWRLALAVAATLVVAIGTVLLRGALAERALGDRVAAEVAMNHTKDLDVEIAAASYPELGAALDKLTFPLTEPSKLANHDLLGGRYCSIQAQLAAQLKVRADDGRTATLYVTELTPGLVSLSGARREVDGIAIEMWSENGLLFALAETRSQRPSS
ncbi:MAG: hypothetical protein MPN21_17770 [Thermoanaerobaculia bacterium]|nr:hypothetical protein [Thermoanaerobaculia bacterium]